MSADVPSWHETARLLMAHPKCPEGLALHTVSGGGPAYQCGPCGAAVSEEEAEGENCPHCDAGDFPDDWIPEQSWPDAVRIIALGSDPAGLANEGPLRAALCAEGFELQINYWPKHEQFNVSIGFTIYGPRQSYAHALALVLLGARR